MDLASVERLAPSLAWPIITLIIFLIALPVLSRKLDLIAKALADLREAPEALTKTLERFQPTARAIADESQVTHSQLQALQERMSSVISEFRSASEELDKARASLEFARTAIEEDRIEVDTAAIKSLVGEANSVELSEESDVQEMHQKLIGNWKLLERELDARAASCGLTFDQKRPGALAYALTDRRRRNYLTREQADLITRLGRQYRKFDKLADQTEEWLTAESYSAFMSGVNSAREAIKYGHTIGASAPDRSTEQV